MYSNENLVEFWVRHNASMTKPDIEFLPELICSSGVLCDPAQDSVYKMRMNV